MKQTRLCRRQGRVPRNAGFLRAFPILHARSHEIDTDFRSLFVNHNHLFYYKEGSTVIIAEMFGEKEDFMYKLFGISGRTQESIDYWGE